MQGVSKVEALRITGTVFQNAIALLWERPGAAASFRTSGITRPMSP